MLCIKMQKTQSILAKRFSISFFQMKDELNYKVKTNFILNKILDTIYILLSILSAKLIKINTKLTLFCKDIKVFGQTLCKKR